MICEKSINFPDRQLERDTYGAPCECGGYMDRSDATIVEVGDRCPCCICAFTCRVCKDRSIVHLPAPEMT